MSDETVLHVVFVKSKGQIVAIPLSGSYIAEITYSDSPGALTTHPITVCIKFDPDCPPPLFANSIGSITTVFGENGSGKTEFLLNLCRAGSSKKKDNLQIGLLWSNGPHVFLSRGGVLKDVDLNSDNIELTECPLPAITSTFYTTSPFENIRKVALGRQGVNDVSPVFGGRNEFDAAALFRSYPFLAGRDPFVDRARIEVRVKLPSIRSLIEFYGPEKFAASWSRRNLDFQRRLNRFDKELTPDLLFRLSIALHLLAEEPGRKALDLAQDLAHLVGGVSGDIPIDQRPEGDSLSTEVEKLLDSLEPGNRDRLSTRAVADFIQRLFEGNQHQRRVAMIRNLETLMGEAIRRGETVFRMLNRLGILRWRFIDLSSGQIAMLMLYVAVARALGGLEQQSDNNTFHFLCIDEGEMFMHPRWQRQYIAGLLNFMDGFQRVAPRTHLFVSTHSLIVAADTPPSRLFDLDKQSMVNGFGLNPKQTLKNVFHVEEFAGEFSSRIFNQVTKVLRENRATSDEMNEAFKIAATLSDDVLKAHVERELDRIAGIRHAQS